MPRFFVPAGALDGETVTLTGDTARHIAYSLRMAAGDTVTLADGAGVVSTCRLEVFDGETVVARVLERTRDTSELPVAVRLYQGVPKGDKLEWIVQKAVELGAAAVVPFVSRFCVVRPNPERAEKQTARLSRIACEAASQSGRTRLPDVSRPLSFEDALADARATCDAVLFCYEGETAVTLREALESAKATGAATLGLFVGAEGGFAPEEVARARENGAVSVTFGPRILRCETAPLYALSCVGYTFEK